MEPELEKTPANRSFFAIGLIFLLLSAASFILGMISLYQTGGNLGEDLGKIIVAESDSDRSHVSDYMAYTLLNHYLSIYLKPIIFALIGFLILLGAISLCSLSRPIIRVSRPIKINRVVREPRDLSFWEERRLAAAAKATLNKPDQQGRDDLLAADLAPFPPLLRIPDEVKTLLARLGFTSFDWLLLVITVALLWAQSYFWILTLVLFLGILWQRGVFAQLIHKEEPTEVMDQDVDKDYSVSNQPPTTT